MLTAAVLKTFLFNNCDNYGRLKQIFSHPLSPVAAKKKETLISFLIRITVLS